MPYNVVVLSAISEKAMTPHSSTLSWKISWTEEPDRLQSMGCEELDTTERLSICTIIEPISRKSIVPRLAASAYYSNCFHIKTKRIFVVNSIFNMKKD